MADDRRRGMQRISCMLRRLPFTVKQSDRPPFKSSLFSWKQAQICPHFGLVKKLLLQT